MRYTMVRKKELHLIVTAVAGGAIAVHGAVLIDYLKSAFNWIKKNYKVINIVSGSLLVAIGILMATGMLGRFLSLLG